MISGIINLLLSYFLCQFHSRSGIDCVSAFLSCCQRNLCSLFLLPRNIKTHLPYSDTYENHLITIIHSFSQNAIPYRMIFFIPRRSKPTAYFFSSICLNASVQAASNFLSFVYFNSITIPVRAGVHENLSANPPVIGFLILQIIHLLKNSDRQRIHMKSRLSVTCFSNYSRKCFITFQCIVL